MIIELVGVRFIAPDFGTSIYVWTAIIGVILGALAFGYWYGGRLADKSATDEGLMVIFLLASVAWLASVWLRDSILELAGAMPGGLRGQAFVASLLLFAPVSALLGMVSPYLVKLKLVNLKTAGRYVGGLYAAGTVGSIAGTFAAGYWLIPLFNSRAVGWAMVFALLGISLLAQRRKLLIHRLIVAVAAVLLLVMPTQSSSNSGVIYDGDGLYSRYQVIDGRYHGRPVRHLVTDKFTLQSSIYIGDPYTPVLDYSTRMDEVIVQSQPRRMLLIGGGSYTLAQLAVLKNPKVTVDVVEIDPMLDELAVKYFSFKPDKRIKIIHEDGRTFLNKLETKYDLIVMDAFSSQFPPFQLTTVEVLEKIKESLTPGGLVMANIISAAEGPEAGFLQAQYLTYQEVFSKAVAFQATPGANKAARLNVILLAAEDNNLSEYQKPEEGRVFLSINTSHSKVLTDDFAPVEALTARGFY